MYRNMKHKIILTSHAEILVVELPEDAHNFRMVNGNLCYDCLIAPEPFTIPEGDWQPLNFLGKISEEQAQRLVDKEGNRYYDYEGNTFLYKDTVFKDAALQSLHSLIEANVLMKNPFGDKEPEFEDTGDIEGDYNYWANKVTEWQEAEDSVFHNPHYFFKLKY